MAIETVTKKKKRIHRKIREMQLFARALKKPHQPILAHLVPIRRCNLACTYCNEFDRVSRPVPTAEMLGRVDKLAELGTSMVHLSGGEPMLHPDLNGIIGRIRERGMIAGLLTNGLLLSPGRIEGLNRAGLDHLQISIDNVNPDDVSKKSLKVLDRKLQALARHAEFDVNINSVLGNELDNPEDALAIAERALELGLTSTVGIIHDNEGQLKAFSPRHRRIYHQIKSLEKPIFRASSHNPFQENLIRGRANKWHCRAGSRYLYICEDGRVHYCSQQRGTPGIPLSEYTALHLEQEARTEKSCAPFCTVSCVHRTALMDQMRENPRSVLQQFYPSKNGNWTPAAMPLPVRALAWMFLPDEEDRKSGALSRAALKLLRIR